ncbi:MAG: hypothetical protein AB1641_28070 [Thermodesulfobacteriota bacterium]
MRLLTKENCGKCDKIKEAFDLAKMGIQVEVINPDDPEILADLAWHELVEVVEQGGLPILLLEDGSYINYLVPIKRFLKERFRRAAH